LTRNNLFGYQFPSTWFQSVQPICLLLLAPVFAQLWLHWGDRQPSSVGKFIFGLLFVGFGFAALVYASSLTGSGLVSPLWLIGLYLLHTIGELCLSPVGLSTVTRLAPVRMVGLMMGVWFLSISIGSFLAGKVASHFDNRSVLSLVKLFGFLTLAPIGAAILLAVLTPKIKSLFQRKGRAQANRKIGFDSATEGP
jgi:POT family proton-dependent oligopeptide transporter